jgi:hypothetical protein
VEYVALVRVVGVGVNPIVNRYLAHDATVCESRFFLYFTRQGRLYLFPFFDGACRNLRTRFREIAVVEHK